MRVLCMGMARTGTNSMTIALRKLGLNPYHGSECFKNPPRDFNLWIEAMQCNFFNPGDKKPYAREEFDRLLGPYDACLDVPACMFWADLHRAYPDAKIILTKRDVDSWVKSANKTVFKFVQMPFFRFWQYVDSTCIGPLYRKSDLVWRIFCNGDFREEVTKQKYLEHYEKIRNAVPKEQLLEFEIGKDGWEELCGFLGTEVPDEPWPNAYSTAEFQEHIDIAHREALWTIARWLGMGVVGAMGTLGWLYYRG